MTRRSYSPGFLHNIRHPFSSRRRSHSLSPPGSPAHSHRSLSPLSSVSHHHHRHHGSHIASAPIDIALLIREAYEYFRDSMSRRRSQSWHRRVYGGMTDTAKMMAVELGAAAGFEAWRRYNHRHGVTHGGDHEGQVRSLVEMAIHEVDRLWGHGDRHGDSHGKGKALLAAAAIALKYLHKGDHGRHTHGKHRSHRGHSSDSDSSSSSSSSDDGGRGRSFLRHAGEAAAVAGVGKLLRDRSGHRSGYDGYSEYGGPSSFGGRSHYGGYGDEYYRGRSPYGHHHHHRGSDLLSTALPALEAGHRHHHRRAYSSGRHSPLEGLLSDLTLGSRHDYPRRDYDYYDDDYGYGRHHRHHRHGGTSVIHTTSGDPTSEFGHLRPGTYVIEGGSRRHRSRGPRLLE